MVDVPVLLLALEDFVPVVLSAIALSLLARLCRGLDTAGGRAATIGAVLIPLGGLSKPVYKTILALSGRSQDLVFLDDALFWFLAPGFLLLAVGVEAARRADGNGVSRESRWGSVGAVVVVAVAVLLAAVGSSAWFFLLLAVATVGNVLAVVALVRWARARHDPLAMALYAASLVIVFVLAWAAASLEQTIAVQWGEQLASTASQAMFLVASIRLVTAVRAAAPINGAEATIRAR